MNTSKAVVLVSGGLDSATALAIAKGEGFSVTALSFDYGQRHKFELAAAGRVAAANDVAEHIVFRLDTCAFAGSALTDQIAVPKDRSESQMESGIPVTYVPARNTVFLSVALGLAESLGAFEIFIGVNAVDYSGYPDCRPEFIEAFEAMANLATKCGVEGTNRVRIRTPLISMTKGEIIRRGLELGVDYSLTHSCYDPAADAVSCGACDACRLRLKGFADSGTADPIPYAR